MAIDFPIEDWAKEEGIADEEIRERVKKAADELYQAKREKFTPAIMQQIEKAVVLQTIDQLWRDHIITVEQLRQVIHLRGYGQRDPLNEYKSEGYNLFEAMISKLRELTTAQVMRVEIQSQASDDIMQGQELYKKQGHHHHPKSGYRSFYFSQLDFF